jgi:hypothetical protein
LSSARGVGIEHRAMTQLIGIWYARIAVVKPLTIEKALEISAP